MATTIMSSNDDQQPRYVLIVYNGQLTRVTTFDRLSQIADKVYKWKPRMLKFYYKHLKILVFTSLKFRVFTRNEDNVLPTLNQWIELLKVEKLCIKYLQTTNSTCTCKLGYYINLYKLARALPLHTFSYEPEIISYMRILRYKPISTHIFASGAVVIMGRDKDLVHSAKTDIIPYLKKITANAKHS